MTRILIADDDFTVGMQIEEMLTALGYELVGQAGSGRETIEMARNLKPDIILMDIVMPGELNGIEAAIKIRAESDIPIVFISGHGESKYIQEAKQINPHGYVMKPFDENEIKAFVEIALHKHKMEKQLKQAHEQLERTNRHLLREIKERQEKQEFSAHLLKSSPNPILVIGPDTAVQYVNPAFEGLTGFSSSEVVGTMAPYPWWTNDTSHTGKRDFQEVVVKGPRKIEEGFQTKEGDAFWVEMNSIPFIKDGDPLYVLSNWVDITDRKRTQDVLEQNEKRYRSVIQTAMDGFWIMDTKGKFLEVNPAYARMSGYSMEELMKMTISDVEVGECHEEITQRMQKSMKAGFGRFETVYRRKDKSTFDVEINFRYLSLNGGIFLSFIRDITGRKEAEEALRESEERYRRLAENSPDMIYRMSLPAGIYEYVSPMSITIFGYSPEEWYDNPLLIREIVHPDWHSYFKAKWEDLLQGHIPPIYEYEIIRKDGDVRWINQRNILVRDHNGSPVAIEGVVTDITESKRAEEVLRESEEKLRVIFDTVYAGVILVDASGVITYANRRMAEMFGYDMEEIIGTYYPEHLHESQTDDGQMKMFQLIRGDIDHVLLERFYRKKDGTTFWGHFSGSRLCRSDGSLSTLVGVMTDVTEKKELEAQLRQAQKMEALGTLAGGIAHDFNNLLSVILGNAELAMADLPEWNTARQNLREAKKACLKARDVVRQILSFSRKTEAEQKPLNLASVVVESLQLLRASIPANIDIRQSIANDLADILGDFTQIHQVVMNLCTNAAHAMEDAGGILEVALTNETIYEDSAFRYPGLTPGPYVNLCVSDSGNGISPEVMDRIFDPYFTTKDVNKGTGLGLSVVLGMVKGHHGRIMVESKPGAGTKFKILFPAMEGHIKEQPKEHQVLPVGKESILFVDDEETLVNLNQQRLERLGYTVTGKTDPVEALEFFLGNPDRIDLIITDMTMPHMTGDKLAQEILKIRPDMLIILCTGYNERISKESALELGVRKYLEKPIEMANLARSVREVLDAGGSRP